MSPIDRTALKKPETLVDSSNKPKMGSSLDDKIDKILNGLETMESNMSKGMMNLRASMSILRDEIMSRITALEARVAALEKTSSDAQTKVENEINHHALGDTYEALFSGIPLSIESEPLEIIKQILSAMKVPHLANFIIQIREWTVKSKQKRTESSAIDPVPTPSKPSSRSMSQKSHTIPAESDTNLSNPTKAFVVMFSSVAVRDLIVANRTSLKDINASEIFTSAGPSKLFVRPLWPKPVHDLWCAAADCSERLGYARPVIRNLNVFMRKSRDSPMVLILNSTDLAAFKSTPTPD